MKRILIKQVKLATLNRKWASTRMKLSDDDFITLCTICVLLRNHSFSPECNHLNSAYFTYSALLKYSRKVCTLSNEVRKECFDMARNEANSLRWLMYQYALLLSEFEADVYCGIKADEVVVILPML